jgi:hypothetical protein
MAMCLDFERGPILVFLWSYRKAAGPPAVPRQQCGHAADCKSVQGGSTLARASKSSFLSVTVIATVAARRHLRFLACLAGDCEELGCAMSLT